MALKAAFGKLKDILQKFLPHALKIGGNGAIAGFLYVFEEMLEKLSPCPCVPDGNAAYTVTVLVMPAVILYMICAFVSSDSRRVLKCGPGCTSPRGETCNCCTFPSSETCSCCESKCPRIQVCFPMITLLKVGFPSVLWIVIVLLDGDYYTCSKIQNGTREMCENYCSSNTTRRSPDLDYYCFKSRMIGAILLTVTVTLLVLLYFLPAWKCGDCTVERYYEAKYQNMVEKMKMQELKNKVDGEWENKAKEDAKESVKELFAKLKLGKPKQNVEKPNVPAGNMEETIPLIDIKPNAPIGH